MTMAVSTVAGTSYQANLPSSDIVQDFRKLVSSLKSGDLAGAQQAYAALDQAQASGQGRAIDPNSPFGKALAQIGQALQNGDLAGAQQALASLSQHGAHRNHHHHHGSGSPSGQSAGGGTAGADGSTVNIVTVNIVA
jgi:hypothetical protein